MLNRPSSHQRMFSPARSGSGDGSASPESAARLKIATLAILVGLASGSAFAQPLYKCKDAKGKTYYTQTPPTECLGKEMDELSKQGTVVKKREAALTPEQLAAREAEEKRKKEQEALAKEEKRKNQALLNTYASEKDIEEGRQRALKQAEQSVKDIEKRIEDAEKRASKLAAEKEFYAKKPMPKKLQEDIRNNEIDLKSQQDALAAKKKDLGDVNAKYDEDKRRYLELTGAKAKGEATPAAAAKK